MSKLLDSLKDEELDFNVTVTDTEGVTAEYEFLDIVSFEGKEYAVLLNNESEDGFVDIFKIITEGEDESYCPVKDDATLDKVFELFRLKNEDEFDFE